MALSSGLLFRLLRLAFLLFARRISRSGLYYRAEKALLAKTLFFPFSYIFRFL